MLKGRIGVGIVSFDRPDYLAQLVESLEGQTCGAGVEYHLWQDGAVNEFSGRECADPVDIEASVAVFAGSSLERRFFHVREGNVGVAINQFEGIETMVQFYDYVLMIEDDVVLSRYYLRLVRVLLAQLEGTEDVFGVCLGFKKLCRPGRLQENLDKIFRTCGHWWAEAFYADRWARMRPFFLDFYELVEGIDYVERPTRAIQAVFRRHGWPSPVDSQDAAKDMAIYAAGMERVRTVVNRAVSVGERGVHFNPGVFRRLGFHRQGPYVFEGDQDLEKFEWRR